MRGLDHESASPYPETRQKSPQRNDSAGSGDLASHPPPSSRPTNLSPPTRRWTVFYCAALKLAVEIDGELHLTDDNIERDARRTAWLNAQGIEVLRIPAAAVLRDADEATEQILQVTATRLANQRHIP